MTANLREVYNAYLDCLNRQAWPELDRFVAAGVVHNDRAFGVEGYREMLMRDYQDIPDLRFTADMVICEPPLIAARLVFHCSPKAMFLNLPVNGQTVTFTENVFYQFDREVRIKQVW